MSDKTLGDRERRPPAELMLTWSDIEPILDQAVVLEELSLDPPDVLTRRLPLANTRRRATAGRQPRYTSQRNRRRSSAAAFPTALPTSNRRATSRRTVLFVASTHGRAERTVELLHDYDVRALLATKADERVEGAVLVTEGLLSKGFRLPTPRSRSTPRPTSSKRSGAGPRRSASVRWPRRSCPICAISRLATYIVHVDHGIGQFVGLKQLSIGQGDIVQEFLELRYHGDDKMFVPVERLDLIQKYTRRHPVARSSWRHVLGEGQEKVKKAMRDMAEELLQALRRASRRAGPRVPAPTHTGRRSSKTRSNGI